MSMATRPRERSRALPVPTLVDCPVGSEVLLPRLYDEDGEGYEEGDLYWEWTGRRSIPAASGKSLRGVV